MRSTWPVWIPKTLGVNQQPRSSKNYERGGQCELFPFKPGFDVHKTSASVPLELTTTVSSTAFP